MKRSIKLSMYLIGSIVGAGFASGKELVAFLGAEGLNVYSALFCFILIFICCFVFLKAGSITKAGNFSAANIMIAPKLHSFFDVCVVFNAFIVLAAMMAGISEVGNRFFNLGCLYSILAAVVVAVIVAGGKGRVVNGSFVMVFFVIAIIIAVSSQNISAGISVLDGKVRVSSCVCYVAMNMLLASGVMLSEKDLKTSECFIVSVITSVIIGILVFILGYAIKCAGCENSEMPILVLAERLGDVAYFFAVALLLLSILTTMLTVVNEISTFLSVYFGKTYSLIISCIVGLIISFLGFEKVVESFYPIIGVIGLAYLIVTLKYLTPFAVNVFFKKSNDKIHNSGKNAKNNGGHHNKIKFKNLASENNKISKSGV